MLNARSTLLENFDESVKEKLRIDLRDSLLSLNTFEQRLWALTQYSLKDVADFDEPTYCFHVHKRKELTASLFGNYCMVIPKEGEKKSRVILPANRTGLSHRTSPCPSYHATKQGSFHSSL